ncbi:hypothetical protein [Clostridium arbusti]|uniref:hypothetical protein n=1 Tax=Clostridium arbusti TaxID=1137848 RepID=UPI00028A2D69|nr:hypothetical protein [Clostridium arbusti]
MDSKKYTCENGHTFVDGKATKKYICGKNNEYEYIGCPECSCKIQVVGEPRPFRDGEDDKGMTYIVEY